MIYKGYLRTKPDFTIENLRLFMIPLLKPLFDEGTMVYELFHLTKGREDLKELSEKQHDRLVEELKGLKELKGPLSILSHGAETNYTELIVSLLYVSTLELESTLHIFKLIYIKDLNNLESDSLYYTFTNDFKPIYGDKSFSIDQIRKFSFLRYLLFIVDGLHYVKLIDKRLECVDDTLLIVPTYTDK